MKKIMLMSVCFWFSTTSLAVVQGQDFPAISIANHAQGQMDRKQMTGKVTVMNFWATWCEACKVELAEMEDAFRPFMFEKNFNVAFVSMDKDPKKAVEWFKKNLKEPGMLLEKLYVDPTFQAAETLNVDAFPMTFIIDQSGKVQNIYKGFEEGAGTTNEMVKVIRALMKKST